MSDLIITYIAYINFAMISGGAFFYVSFGLYFSYWKPYIKKERLSQAEFVRASKLVGASMFIATCGLVITLLIPIWQDPQPEAIIPAILMSLLCLAGFPAVGVGIFVFSMKKNQFVKPPDK